MSYLTKYSQYRFGRTGRKPFAAGALFLVLGLSALFVSSVANGEESEQLERHPNVIVLLVDDLAYGDIGAYGCPDIPTPCIDSLAHSGMRCLNGYTVCTLCSPSRCGLMTGMYPERFGVFGNTDRGQPIPANHPILAEFMRDAGYLTGMVGRWDIGDRTQGPLDRGFKEVARRAARKKPVDADLPTYLGIDGSYVTEVQGKELADFVTRHKSEPFFLYFAPLAVHSPVADVPQKYLDRVSKVTLEARRPLAATLIALDDAIGQLLSKLRELNLDNNTIIFFTGDNGGWEPDHARNAPYRGGKATGWDGGVHEPFLVRWTGHLPAGVDYSGLISTLDIFATAAELTGKPKPNHLDGVNLIPYLQGSKGGDPHDALFWDWESATTYFARAVRAGSMRYMVDGNRGDANERHQLFDLTVDPGETNNLVTSRAEVAAALAKKLDVWKSELPQWVKHTSLPQREPPSGQGWATRPDASATTDVPNAGT
jgi:arylsulfatase A-like enzyme